MPLVQIDLNRTTFETFGTQIGDEIHRALVIGLGVPEGDRFQVFRPRRDGELIYDLEFGGVHRTGLVLIQVLTVPWYTAAQKQTFFTEAAERLERLGVPRTDIFIAMTENRREDWYAGGPTTAHDS